MLLRATLIMYSGAGLAAITTVSTHWDVPLSKMHGTIDTVYNGPMYVEILHQSYRRTVWSVRDWHQCQHTSVQSIMAIGTRNTQTELNKLT